MTTVKIFTTPEETLVAVSSDCFPSYKRLTYQPPTQSRPLFGKCPYPSVFSSNGLNGSNSY